MYTVQYDNVVKLYIQTIIFRQKDRILILTYYFVTVITQAVKHPYATYGLPNAE